MTFSASITVGPLDKRCKYIAKLIRDGFPIPTPAEISEVGARAIALKLASNGDEELFPGDVLIEVEQKNPRRDGGYRCRMVIVDQDAPEGVRYIEPSSIHKQVMKSAGLPVELLPGAGPLAGCIRILHAMRLGVEWE